MSKSIVKALLLSMFILGGSYAKADGLSFLGGLKTDDFGFMLGVHVGEDGNVSLGNGNDGNNNDNGGNDDWNQDNGNDYLRAGSCQVGGNDQSIAEDFCGQRGMVQTGYGRCLGTSHMTHHGRQSESSFHFKHTQLTVFCAYTDDGNSDGRIVDQAPDDGSNMDQFFGSHFQPNPGNGGTDIGIGNGQVLQPPSNDCRVNGLPCALPPVDQNAIGAMQ
jgi:hypothetical protein